MTYPWTFLGMATAVILAPGADFAFIAEPNRAVPLFTMAVWAKQASSPPHEVGMRDGTTPARGRNNGARPCAGGGVTGPFLDLPDLVIFDCDGVLVDSEPISLQIQAERLTALGLPTTYEDCVHDFLGIGMPATVDEIQRRLGGPLPTGWLEDLDHAVRAAFADRLRPIPGIEIALAALATRTCIASSGSHSKIRYTLGLTGLWSHFEGRIFSGDEVGQPKPAPDLFLHAAAAMSAQVERCIVVEDSPYGVQAGKAAGMLVAGFAATTPAESLAEADAVFNDMTDLPSVVKALARRRLA